MKLELHAHLEIVCVLRLPLQRQYIILQDLGHLSWDTNCTHYPLIFFSRYIQGLIDYGVPGLMIDSRLIQECLDRENALIPMDIFTQLHQKILQEFTFENLMGIRDRIFLNVQITYSLSEYIKFVMSI